jgi:hypothetical protein
MREILLTLVSAALVAGIFTFEAHATIRTAAYPQGYSLVETAACDARGLFCPKGSQVRCNPLCNCEPCSKKMRTTKPKK